ncbi:MAG: metallophosphoesterase family protein [Deltaproteobacteria bacterium]
MKYAIISDIHGNLQALEAVLGRIDSLGADSIICLGDIVGYGASPNECAQIIAGRGIESILGNHDAVACGRQEADNFTPMAKRAVLWTRDTLTPETRDFLLTLPESRHYGEFMAVHGAISDPNLYIMTIYEAIWEFTLMDGTNLCFFGHTHMRITFSRRASVVKPVRDMTIELQPGLSYLVNPGSVGQPRDGNPNASFLIYDSAAGRIEYFRVEYDIKTAQRKIIDAALDTRLAERLALGV